MYTIALAAGAAGLLRGLGGTCAAAASRSGSGSFWLLPQPRCNLRGATAWRPRAAPLEAVLQRYLAPA